MSNINTVTISGNLTRDVEVYGKDLNVAKFGVAVNRSYKPKDAEDYAEEVSFIDVTAFSGLGSLCARKMKKGDAVTVQGRLKQETWETDEGKRSKVIIIADEIDGDWKFRAKDEDNVPTAATAPAAEATEAPAAAGAPAADDDIPF